MYLTEWYDFSRFVVKRFLEGLHFMFSFHTTSRNCHRTSMHVMPRVCLTLHVIRYSISSQIPNGFNLGHNPSNTAEKMNIVSGTPLEKQTLETIMVLKHRL